MRYADSSLKACVVCALLMSAWAVPAMAETAQPATSHPAGVPEERIVTADGSITIDGSTLDYTTTAGTLLVRKQDGEPDAELFYMAYTLKDADPLTRPVTFIWNGGPGARPVPGHRAYARA